MDDWPTDGARIVRLPPPCIEGSVPLEAALSGRRSVREYTDEPVSLAELSQLLWAAQGVTHSGYGRTAPSAGALYPIELYVVASKVDGLAKGLYRYRVREHDLAEVTAEDVQRQLASAALGQESLERAAAVIVVAGVVDRVGQKYGRRALRYVHMEVGAVVENVLLQATALKLGAVFIGAFNDKQVRRVLGMVEEEDAFAILPVGKSSRWNADRGNQTGNVD